MVKPIKKRVPLAYIGVANPPGRKIRGSKPPQSRNLSLECALRNVGFDHINRNAPVLIRTPKLTRFEPAQYWGGGPPGNSVVLNPLFFRKTKTQSGFLLLLVCRIPVSVSQPSISDNAEGGLKIHRRAPVLRRIRRRNTYDLQCGETKSLMWNFTTCLGFFLTPHEPRAFFWLYTPPWDPFFEARIYNDFRRATQEKHV